jgi:hypothetical protein
MSRLIILIQPTITFLAASHYGGQWRLKRFDETPVPLVPDAPFEMLTNASKFINFVAETVSYGTCLQVGLRVTSIIPPT